MRAAHSIFVDTNVLLYSVDSSQEEKRKRVWTWLAPLWEQGLGRLSWQVLHEFYVNALRKLYLDSPEARKLVRSYVQWRPGEITLGLIERAWEWNDVAHLPYWDALIVAAAERAGCDFLLSEDFQSGQRFGAVTVVNPFLQDPEQCGLNAVR